ncbi:MAG: hypothetical protein FJ146_14950 [Deltaproteobacteria bacterium]|nr:hypothetical protein [Deltaproteobacteria bacterium]
MFRFGEFTSLASLILGVRLITGCQTLAPMPPPTVPKAVFPYFGRCNPGDGAASAQVFRNGDILGSAEVSWIARDLDFWELEVTDPLGNTILGAKHQAAQIRLRGALASRVPVIQVGSANRVLVGGDFVGIKADEVPCMLHARFPQSWLAYVQDVMQEGDYQVLTIDDGARTINARLPTREGDTPPCAHVSWRHHWLFRETMNWCLPRGQSRVVTLKGVGDFSLNFTRLEDQ